MKSADFQFLREKKLEQLFAYAQSIQLSKIPN